MIIEAFVEPKVTDPDELSQLAVISGASVMADGSHTHFVYETEQITDDYLKQCAMLLGNAVITLGKGAEIRAYAVSKPIDDLEPYADKFKTLVEERLNEDAAH